MRHFIEGSDWTENLTIRSQIVSLVPHSETGCLASEQYISKEMIEIIEIVEVIEIIEQIEVIEVIEFREVGSIRRKFRRG